MVYLPPAFTENREEVLLDFIGRHDFGLLVSHGQQGMIASQVPFLIERREGRLYLLGHLARPNPQNSDLAAGGEVLAIFHGPHAYVSPTWYEKGPAVPTWNYASVHAYGTVSATTDPDRLRDLLERLSQHHEAREPTAPWQMADQPEAYMASMLKGVVGFEIAVERLEGKFKLSQNRPAVDRPRIIAALAQRDDAASRCIAEMMRDRED